MKIKYILLSIIFVLVIAAAFLGYQLLTTIYEPETSEASETKIAASDFTVYDAEGAAVSLSTFRGKPVVVNFWATWCGPCQMEMPCFEALSKEYEDRVQFMMVNLTDGQRETVDYVSQFLAVNGYTFPAFYDVDLDAATTYSVYSIPLTLFVDEDGTLIHSHTGAMDEETLRNYIEDLIKE